MPSSVNCKGRRSKNEPVEGEWIVHGFGGGFESVAARDEGNDERRRSKNEAGKYMAGSVENAMS